MASSLCFARRNRSSASRASGENRKIFVPLGCVTIPNGSKPRASRCPAVGTERVRISISLDESIGNLTFRSASCDSSPCTARMRDEDVAEPHVVNFSHAGIVGTAVVAHGADVLGGVNCVGLGLHHLILAFFVSTCVVRGCRREPTPGGMLVDSVDCV